MITLVKKFESSPRKEGQDPPKVWDMQNGLNCTESQI